MKLVAPSFCVKDMKYLAFCGQQLYALTRAHRVCDACKQVCRLARTRAQAQLLVRVRKYSSLH